MHMTCLLIVLTLAMQVYSKGYLRGVKSQAAPIFYAHDMAFNSVAPAKTKSLSDWLTEELAGGSPQTPLNLPHNTHSCLAACMDT